MPTVFVTTRSGQEVTIQGQPGRSLMEVIRDAGIDDIEAICGGACACSTCHVYVDHEDLTRLAAMSDMERELLAASAPKPGSRLACQIQMSEALAGLRVRIAP
jgi:ferredoxin, 2Fe-2S